MKSRTNLTRRDFLRLALLAGGAAALSPLLKACGGTAPAGIPTVTLAPTVTATPDPAAGLEGLDIDTFLDESYKRLLQRDPERLTLLGLSAEYGFGNDELTDISDAFIRQTQALEAGILDLLGRYDPAAFTPDQSLNFEVYRWLIDDKVRRHPFMYHDYLVTPFPWNSVPYDILSLFIDAQPLANLQDAHDYISRLGQVKTKYEQLLDALQRRQAAGIVLPRLLVRDTVSALGDMIAGGAASTEFFRDFANRVGALSDLNSADKQDLRDQAEAAIEESVIPGQRLLIDYFDSLGEVAPEEVGLWQFPNGPEYYTYLLRHFTTTEAGADEIHALGLQHVERLRAELRHEFDRLDYPSEESIPALLERAGNESGLVEGEEALAFIQAALERANSVLDQAFDLQPQGELQVVGGEMGNFFVPAPRGSAQPSTFYALTAWPQPRTMIPTTVFHEAIPGHYFQLAVARQFDLPPFREGTEFDGYLDGWALYAERLMWELGVYDDDPSGNLGRLQSELLRAVRVVTDTGIHAKHWTYEEAVDYMELVIGSGGEAKRYIGYPAQAVAYYIGYLKILDLRQRAMDMLGDRFDLKEFHHVLLSNGELPLAILEQLVDAYIASKV